MGGVDVGFLSVVTQSCINDRVPSLALASIAFTTIGLVSSLVLAILSASLGVVCSLEKMSVAAEEQGVRRSRQQHHLFRSKVRVL